MYNNEIYPNYNTGSTATGNFSGADEPKAPKQPTEPTPVQPQQPASSVNWVMVDQPVEPVQPQTQQPMEPTPVQSQVQQAVEPVQSQVQQAVEPVQPQQPTAEQQQPTAEPVQPQPRQAEPTPIQPRVQQPVYQTYQTYPAAQPPVLAEKKKVKKPGVLSKLLVSVSMGLLFGIFAGIGFLAVQQGINATQKKGSTGDAVEYREPPRTSLEQGIAEENKETYQPASSQVVYTSVESDVSDIVDEVMPAMVSIVNNYTQKTYFWGQTFEEELASSGSGIIVGRTDTELLIVSNNHVVADAVKLMVTLIDGTEVEAKIKGVDSDMDLAVISVDLNDLSEETKAAIVVATLGNSDSLRMGQRVIAIGNALGYGQSTTVGYISALNREIELEDGSVKSFIQTDAAINPGNSGGALLNMAGEVIGINSNKIGGTSIEGMGYAIPITMASPIIADLMERQTRNKVAASQVGYIGIQYEEVTEQISQMLSMPKGVYVKAVLEGTGAEAAGMMQGDIIVNFDGNKISSYADLQNAMQYYAAGDTVEITVMRVENGVYKECVLSEVTLGRRPTAD